MRQQEEVESIEKIWNSIQLIVSSPEYRRCLEVAKTVWNNFQKGENLHAGVDHARWSEIETYANSQKYDVRSLIGELDEQLYRRKEDWSDYGIDPNMMRELEDNDFKISALYICMTLPD